MRGVLFSLLLSLLLASGCAVRGPVGSWCGPLPERGAVSAIAADAVACLSALYPPGHTSLHLLQAKDAGNDFAAAFENGLRAKGFTLAATDSADVVIVAYTLDALDEKSAWYLQLRLSGTNGGGKAIARSYMANGQPEAGQSQTEQKFRRSFADKAAAKVRHAWDTGPNMRIDTLR